MELLYKKCTEQDMEVLRELAFSTFVKEFGPVNAKQDLDLYTRKAFSLDQLKNEVNNPHSKFYLVILDDEVVGYFKINEGPAQTEINDDESWEIERIYVKRPFQSRGFGAQILDKVATMARMQGLKFIWLGVWSKNDKAIRFYKRKGYYRFGEHDFMLGTDLQTDNLMRLNLVTE